MKSLYVVLPLTASLAQADVSYIQETDGPLLSNRGYTLIDAASRCAIWLLPMACLTTADPAKSPRAMTRKPASKASPPAFGRNMMR